jgi:catechol 2,3-dioxygenase-like lactoylglutathione lyase family enzyme
VSAVEADTAIKTKRIGHATFETSDLDRQIAHYLEVVGLTLTARDGGHAFLATSTGVPAIVLERTAGRACNRLAFEIPADPPLREVARRLTAAGLRCEERSDAIPGVPRLLAFSDPKGTTVELFSEWSFVAGGEPMGGAAPLKLGHVAFAVPEPRAMAEFYTSMLGFRVSDWIGDYFVFLRCGADHHTVNFIRGERSRMHHIAFELRDTASLHGACDLLGRRRIPIIWGPVRHGPGHNVAIYHRNPDDQMVELFTELDKMLDEERGYFDPRPWHRDRPQKPKVWDPSQPRDIWGPPPGPDFLRADRE